MSAGVLNHHNFQQGPPSNRRKPGERDAPAGDSVAQAGSGVGVDSSRIDFRERMSPSRIQGGEGRGLKENVGSSRGSGFFVTRDGLGVGEQCGDPLGANLGR